MTAYNPNLYSTTNMMAGRVTVNPSEPIVLVPHSGNQVPNYYNIEQTPQLQVTNAIVEQAPQAIEQCTQASHAAATELLHAQHRTGAAGPLGMNAVTSNEYMLPHRTVAMNRPPSNQVFPPMGIPGNGSKQPVIKTALKNARNHQYCPEMYMTPYGMTQNKIATGVLTNTYTGETFQTFEEGLPPPTTNGSLLPSQFQQTNPKLVALQGGIDYNAPPPSKQEISQNVPLVNGGPNVWGDALYQPQIREWLTQRAAMQQWNNRNGILPNYGVWKEHPAGFVGDFNMLRPTPYNPATARNTYDLQGWTVGVNGEHHASAMDAWNVLQPSINNLDPNRGQTSTFAQNVGGVDMPVTIPYDLEASANDLRASLKTLQEQPVPLSNVQPDQAQTYLYNAPDLKPTQKPECDTFPWSRVGSSALVQDNNMYQTAQATELKATNKLQLPVPIHNVSSELPISNIDLTAPSEKTETRRQYYSDKSVTMNPNGEQFSVGNSQGPQAYAEWTKVAKRGGQDAQRFRIVPNRTTDSLSNQANFSPGCSQRDIYPETLREAPVRLQLTDNTAFQTDFTVNQPRMLPAQTTCHKKGNLVESESYAMPPMALSMMGQM